MTHETRTYIEGEFNGYNDGAVFRLANGEVWQQSRYRYQYKYAYRPKVRIYRHAGKYIMEVSVMNEPVEVIQAEMVTEGTIVSDFSGFNSGMKFEFQNGHVWEQVEHRYNYHYANRPRAMIINGLNGYQLHVDGMGGSVRVRRV